MNSQHAQKAQELMNQQDPELQALTYAQLETAEQIERLANMAAILAAEAGAVKSIAAEAGKDFKRFLTDDGPAATAFNALLGKFFGGM